jgi:hypothetical protein
MFGLVEIRLQSVGRGQPYPEGNVVDFDTFAQQRVRESHLSQCFDCLGLNAVGSTGFSSFRSVVDNDRFDTITDKVVSTVNSEHSILVRQAGLGAYANISPDGPAPTTTTSLREER